MACFKAGFVPPADIRRLQDYLRLRAGHVSSAASNVQHMPGHEGAPAWPWSLERMNIKLRAIIAGERSPEALLALCDQQIRRAKAEQVKEALRGTWEDEHIFALRRAVQSWDHYQQQIAECDRQIQAVLPAFDPDRPALPRPKTPKRAGVNSPDIPRPREIMAQMCGGRDLTQLPAHTHYGVLQIVGEVGTDLAQWPTEKHFTAWAGLAPGNHDSGKRKGRVKRGAIWDRSGCKAHESWVFSKTETDKICRHE